MGMEREEGRIIKHVYPLVPRMLNLGLPWPMEEQDLVVVNLLYRNLLHRTAERGLSNEGFSSIGLANILFK